MLKLMKSLPLFLALALFALPMTSHAVYWIDQNNQDPAEQPKPQDVPAAYTNEKADSKMRVLVSIKDQEMQIFLDDKLYRKWTISTGAEGFDTPPGKYSPTRIFEDYYSKQYDYARMQHSVFFYQGYAIHGSYNLFTFGAPASHGCIRLPQHQAKTFLELVKERSSKNVSIEIVSGSIS